MGGTLETATVPTIGAVDQAPGSDGSTALRRLKLVLAVLAIPACAGFGSALYDHTFTFGTKARIAIFGWPEEFVWFATGAALFTAMAVLLIRPVVTYVFAHELTHAMATWVCLGKVSNLRASVHGGEVTTSKTNTLIRLAPYCVPLYAILIAVVYLALNAWWRTISDYHYLHAAALGFSYAFHVGFTLYCLRRDQPDLKSDGWLFSMIVIYMTNLLFLAALLGLVTSGNANGAFDALIDVARGGLERSGTAYSNIVRAMADAMR